MELLVQCASCFLCSPKFSPWTSHYVNSNGILRKPNRMSALNSGLIENGSISFGRMKSLVVNASNGGAEVETAVVVDEPKLRRFQVFDGSPAPFGATARDGGVNFAVYSSNAVSATLCLMSLSDLQEKSVAEQISLNPLTNRTGDVWHVFLKGDFEDMLYCYKFDGKFSPEEGHYYDYSQMLLDPYAKAVVSRGEFGVLGPKDECWPQMACMVPSANDEDRSTGRMIGVGHETQGLYHIASSVFPVACNITNSPTLRHSRLGHPSLS